MEPLYVFGSADLVVKISETLATLVCGRGLLQVRKAKVILKSCRRFAFDVSCVETLIVVFSACARYSPLPQFE